MVAWCYDDDSPACLAAFIHVSFYSVSGFALLCSAWHGVVFYEGFLGMSGQDTPFCECDLFFMLSLALFSMIFCPFTLLAVKGV